MTDNKEYIAIDVETTGMSPMRGHRIIEVGAVKIGQNTLGPEFHSLIDCGRRITKGAQKVHGISNSMLHGQPKPENVFQKFRSFVGSADLVAHNAQFDRSFLVAEYGRLGWRLPNQFICTLRLSQRNLPRLSNYKLITIARYLLGNRAKNAQTHRALNDARLAAGIWLKICNANYKDLNKWMNLGHRT
jgi:DNA polymerase III epsilon subunit